MTTFIVDERIMPLADYEYGQSHEVLAEIEGMVKAVTASGEGTEWLAAQLASLLEGDSTVDCKQFVCRQLAIIGGAENVPAIAPLLLDAETADMARYALEPMDNDEAGEALLDALGDAPPSARAGIINSLGRRRSQRAVGAISRQINDTDPAVASAAINALGNIGGSKAVRRLSTSSKRVAREMRRPLEDALLICAHNYLDEGKNRQAAAIFDGLFEDSEYDRVRIAALRGLVKADSERGWLLAVRAVENNSDPSLTIAAKALLQDLID